jgi:hypothetical protein
LDSAMLHGIVITLRSVERARLSARHPSSSFG